MTARKPPGTLKSPGRPRADGSPAVRRKPVPGEAIADPGSPDRRPPPSIALPLPIAPEGDDPQIFKWAGQRVPLIYIARGIGIPIEDLQEGGKHWGTVCRGILAYAADFCEAAYLKARSLTGNPIPGIHWGKCNAKMRETGENETEVKKVRQIKRVSWRVIEGGLKDGPGGGKPTAGRGTDDGPGQSVGTAGGIDSPIPGHLRR